MRAGSGPAAWRGDLRRLWTAYSVSELGSAVGAGALPLIAVMVLDVSAWQVSMLAVVAGIASAAMAVPLAPWIEVHRKRPVMITADLVRFIVLASVPVAAWLGALTYVQLCVVAAVQTGAAIVFAAASGAHLKRLVPEPHRAHANSRFETSLWSTATIGPPVGGLLVSWLGATAAVTVDAATFLLSAIGVRWLRSREPAPQPPAAGRRWLHELTGGWRYIAAHRDLHLLFWNAMIFGGCLMAASPLITVLMLRDLGFTPWQYGLALGIPGIGGIIGSLTVVPLTRRLNLTPRTLLLVFGVARTLWLGAVPLAPAGTAGLIVIIAADTLLLYCAGVFNPTFITYRMHATADTHMTRVATAWSISSKTAQPICIAAGAALAAATSARAAIAVAAAAIVVSTVLLPWRADGVDRAVGVAVRAAPGDVGERFHLAANQLRRGGFPLVENGGQVGGDPASVGPHELGQREPGSLSILDQICAGHQEPAHPGSGAQDEVGFDDADAVVGVDQRGRAVIDRPAAGNEELQELDSDAMPVHGHEVPPGTSTTPSKPAA
ncbi:MFS transporter [Dactylosporangium sp. CA-139066]|uniref:MFS transporter n=1 Tax=Dactylosporangium sp. CA-139066 TaxID=3239930 RepID=UPI003D94AE82